MTDLYTRIQSDLRAKERKRKLADIDKGIRHIQSRLTHEELLRVAYVPFVICRLVWDYTDTIKDLCILLRLTETKRLSRMVRELRLSYERERCPFIEPSVADSEEKNMYVYECRVQHIMSILTTNIKAAINREHPDLIAEHRDLLVAVYQCHALLSALIAYTKKQTDGIARKLGWHMGEMLPESVRTLGPLILEFAGDCRLHTFTEMEKKFIDTFANQMSLIEFSGIK